MMKTAPKVTACRIKPLSPEAPYDQNVSADEMLASYQEGPWMDLSATQVKQFREVLRTPDTYLFDSVSGCIPEFGVRVRFEDPNGRIEINLCLKCRQLVVARDGKFVGAEEFHGAKRTIIALCKELFADDAEIQAVKP
jgi:hypothetical protein